MGENIKIEIANSRTLFNIENLVLGGRSEFNSFAGTSGDLFWSTGVLEYWSVGKTKAHICVELVFSLLHYSTTPSLQQTAARWKDYGSPLWGQPKAGFLLTPVVCRT